MRYLPYGTAVIIFGVVVVTLWQEMNVAAAAMRKRAFSMIDEKLQACLRTVEQAAWASNKAFSWLLNHFGAAKASCDQGNPVAEKQQPCHDGGHSEARSQASHREEEGERS